jgi:hypothetical protein
MPTKNKTLLAAAAILATLSGSAWAQTAPSMGGRQQSGAENNIQTPETLGASRQTSRPEGDVLVRPVTPGQTPPAGPPPAAAQQQNDNEAATNTQTPPTGTQQPD